MLYYFHFFPVVNYIVANGKKTTQAAIVAADPNVSRDTVP
jgi:hypothetical protein